jgi:hypothetical protein
MWNKHPVVRQEKLHRETVNRRTGARVVKLGEDDRVFREGSHDVVTVTGETIIEDDED